MKRMVSSNREELGRGKEYQVKQLMLLTVLYICQTTQLLVRAVWKSRRNLLMSHRYSCLFPEFGERAARGREGHSDFLEKISLLLASHAALDALDYSTNRASRDGLGDRQGSDPVEQELQAKLNIREQLNRICISELA